MARDTLANAKAELFGLLGTADTYEPVASLSSAGVVKVYDHEPRPGDALKGCFVTVEWGGMSPEYWAFTVRVYMSADVSAKKASSTVLNVSARVDGLVDNGGFGPSDWTGPQWVEELNAFIATHTVVCGRADLAGEEAAFDEFSSAFDDAFA